jgi:hypothetical protein
VLAITGIIFVVVVTLLAYCILTSRLHAGKPAYPARSLCHHGLADGAGGPTPAGCIPLSHGYLFPNLSRTQTSDRPLSSDALGLRTWNVPMSPPRRRSP